MHDDMGFIVKPVVQVGQVSPPPVVGCHHPELLTDADYDALPSAAPFRLAEIAAILCGMKPFELEPEDDPAIVEVVERVRRRLGDAVDLGQIPANPTLRDAVQWASEFGCAMVNADRLFAAAGLPMGPRSSRRGREQKRRSDHDLVFQARADWIAERLRAAGKVPTKEVVAELLKRELRLDIKVSSIARRLRRS